MAVIGVDTEEIRSVSQRVRAGADDAEAQRNMLLGQIQGLQGNWQGSASDALQELYQRWDQQAKDLNDTLNQIAQQMGQAADDYDTNEGAVGGEVPVTFKVDTDDLTEISKAFTAAAEEVRTLAGKLSAPPDLSTEQDWGAPEAATGYVETRDSWVTSLGQLDASLDCIATKLSLAAGQYTQTEQAATVKSDKSE